MNTRVIAIVAGVGLTLAGQPVLAQGLAAMGREEVALLQRRLVDAGCYKGPVDGRPAPALDAAAQACPDQSPILSIETGMHTAPIISIGVDAECRIAATGSSDKTVRLWSLPQGKLVRTQRLPIGEGDDGKVFAVTVSRDGRYVAAGGLDVWRQNKKSSVYLFDGATGTSVRRIGAFVASIFHLDFSHDGARLAVALGGDDQGVRVLDVATGQELMASDYKAASYGITFGPDGALYSVADDGYLRRYGPDLKAPPTKVPTPGGTLARSVAIDPTGQRLAVGYGDTAAIDIFEASSLRHLAAADTNDIRNGALASVAWSSDGRRLVAGGAWLRGFAHGKAVAVRSWDPDGRRLTRRSSLHGTWKVSRVPDLPLASNTIWSLKSCGDAIAFTTAEPSFGLIRADGTVAMIGKRQTVNMFAKVGDAFTVSAAGTRLRFGLGYGADDPVLFDLVAGSLVKSPSSPPDLRAPDVEGLDVKNWLDSFNPTLKGKQIPLNQGEMSRSLAVRPDRAGFVLGADFVLRGYSAEGHGQWGKKGPEAVVGVNLAQHGSLVIAAYADGTVRWHRWSDGRELLALFVNKEDLRWIAWTPTGYYTASPGGEDLIGWHINRGWEQPADFFPASRFHDRFYRPDVVALVLQTLDEDAAVRTANAASGRNDVKFAPAAILPPVLDLVSAPTRFATDRVTIQYRVRTPSDAPMIGDPLIKVNGEWQPKSRAVSQIAADGTRELAIGLPPRDSTAEIYADNRNARSEPIMLSLKWDGAALAPGQQGLAAQRKPHLFVLAVGISQYQRQDLRLQFGDHDATQFVAAMEAQRDKRYSEVTTKLLVNGEATLAAIEAGLVWFSSQTAADDVGVLFLAGHGVQTADHNYFYAPVDFDPTHQRETGLDNKAIRSALDKFSTGGNKTLFFVDTCYAGGALGPNLAPSNGAVLAAILSRPDYGVIVLSASKGDQLSYEGDPLWRGGAFTTALLEGIVDAKADAAHTGEITMLNLVGYVTQRVPFLTKQRQVPMLLLPGGGVVDFAIAFH